MKKKSIRSIGRDAKTGKFIPVAVARRRKSTAVVVTFKGSKQK